MNTLDQVRYLLVCKKTQQCGKSISAIRGDGRQEGVYNVGALIGRSGSGQLVCGGGECGANIRKFANRGTRRLELACGEDKDR